LEYRLFKHFSIGSAFDRLSIDGEINPKKVADSASSTIGIRSLSMVRCISDRA
jgi:hypothetical protein